MRSGRPPAPNTILSPPPDVMLALAIYRHTLDVVGSWARAGGDVWSCSADKGVIAGIVIMLVIMIGCCIGLCISDCGQEQQTVVLAGGQLAGDTKPPLIAFSPGCVGLWMCPLACMLCTLVVMAFFFLVGPGPGGTCWHHEQIIALKPGYSEGFAM